ncbi:YrhK family protein [Sphingomonas sp. RS6]
MFRQFIRKYQYIHLGLGLIGNTLFVVGSILFFERFSAWHHLAIWLFVFGSCGMWIGSFGKAIVELERARAGRR